MMIVNGGLVTGGNYRFQLSPHHHQHQHQHCNPHHHHQHQQHPSHNHILNGTCCCSSGGCSHHHPPCHNQREAPSPFPIPVDVGVDDAGSCFFYNEEDDYGNECGVVPVLCKVHNNAPLPSSSSGERREAFCDTRRRGETSNSSCGRATSASSLIPSFSVDRNRSPQTEENKDLNFDGSHLMSGTWEALVQHLLPTEAHFPSEDYIFTFLLSARLHVQPHELLGRIFQEVIDLSGESVGGDEEDAGPGPPPQAFGGHSPSHQQHHSRGNSPRPSSTSPQHHQHFRQGTNLIGTTFTNATGLLDSTDISETDFGASPPSPPVRPPGSLTIIHGSPNGPEEGIVVTTAPPAPSIPTLVATVAPAQRLPPAAVQSIIYTDLNLSEDDEDPTERDVSNELRPTSPPMNDHLASGDFMAFLYPQSQNARETLTQILQEEQGLPTPRDNGGTRPYTDTYIDVRPNQSLLTGKYSI